MVKYLLFSILLIYIVVISSVYAASANDNGELQKQQQREDPKSAELARTRRRPFGLFGHAMGYGFGLHALAILYWLKVKAVIVSFIIGTAIVWGAKYFWAHKKCSSDTIHEGAIIPFEHGPAWSSGYSSHHDHTPYSLSSYQDHDHDHHDPYSAYSSYSDSPPSSTGTEEYITDHKPEERRRQGKRKARQLDNADTEDQISDLMFYFLGVGSDACRKRFLCEWEFKSSSHPMTRMAFRIIGRGVFRKYARDPKDESSAKSFNDCARAHSECTVIEEHIKDADQESTTTEEPLQSRAKHNYRDPIAKAILNRPLKNQE